MRVSIRGGRVSSRVLAGAVARAASIAGARYRGFYGLGAQRADVRPVSVTDNSHAFPSSVFDPSRVDPEQADARILVVDDGPAR
jgi:hypothetical protein